MNTPVTELKKNTAYQTNTELEQGCNKLFYVAEVVEDGYYLHVILDGKNGGEEEMSEYGWVSNYQLKNYGVMTQYN